MPVNSITNLKQTFTDAAKDSSVSLAEAESLIALVKDGGGVTASERRQLRELFVANKDRFDDRADARMTRFIDTEIDGLVVADAAVVVDGSGKKDLNDPAVLKKDTTVTYAWADGVLFKEGATADDLMQGMLGDCFVISGVAAIAAANPGAIEKAIKDNQDGTYTVTLFDPTVEGRTDKTIQVTVDGQLPTRNGGLVYGKNRDRQELWFGILEKAFAQVKGSYDTLGAGGKPSWVMHALTGRGMSETALTEMDEDVLLSVFQECLKRGEAAAITTFGEDQQALYAGTGMYAEHGYSVLRVEEKNGKGYVTLRNPWGEVEPKGDGKDDGIFTIDLATLKKLASHLFLG